MTNRNDILEEAALIADEQAKEDQELADAGLIAEHPAKLCISGAKNIARSIRELKT